MSGHSKWKQIKHKKGAADQKKGQLFSKLSKLISIAAKKGADPALNFELKNTIEKARSFNVPSDNIEKAIKRASEKEAAALEEIRIGAIGPNSVGFIVQAITDNRNRTIGEIKNILKNYNIKMVQPGALLWMFEKKGSGFMAKAPIAITDQPLKEKINKFLQEISEHDDVKEIYSNLTF